VTIEVKVPRLAESISEATLVEWLKPDGTAVRTDEPIATLETDKAAVEIVADAAGVLSHARKPGDVVKVGDVLGRIADGDGSTAAAAAAAPAQPAPSQPAAPKAGPAPAASSAAARSIPPALPTGPTPPAPAPPVLSPAVRRIVEERGLDPAAIPGTGPGGRILKDDAQRFVPAGSAPAAPTSPAAAEPEPAPEPPPALSPEDDEHVVPMSRIRLRIAERLVQAQHTAAILTTFNEIDMSRVMEVRARHKDAFEKAHGVKLGYMSFFARACVLAFGDVPDVNAEIRGTDLVYHRSVHLGIAASTERGLVVPVVRDAHRLDFAGLEREIARMAQRARDGQLTPQELSGGTFTITNGGVFGSLLSTPILNPPQSGILGMHKIEKRPIAVGDDVVVRPMMYVALSYDHRVIDGRQAVTFLVKVKERLEDPERMLLAV
jgi:2-oxoglutarate dehydrogenase E2 component (dihydrolipoamide succinyltransferase)